MTIGFIFECGPQGADKQVCEFLAGHIRPGIKLTSRTLDNKGNLLRDAGRVAAQMLSDGCTCVLIIWDLRPAWPGPKPCRAAERTQVLQLLSEAGVSANSAVFLVCIEQELESWILAADHALSAVLSTPAHPYKVGRNRNPDRVPNPKATVIRHFKSARRWTYDDKVDAIRTIRAAKIELKKLRHSSSFVRFEEKLLACAG